MDKKDKDNSIHLDILLKTYSVKEITNLFTHIDKQIISLHKCSGDDFLQLNSSYKEIYNLSAQISTNIIDILKAFHKDENNNLYRGINVLYEKLKAQFEILDYKILVLNDQFEKLANQIRHVFFPIKNFRQNLMSLNYLLANVKVSLSYTNKSKKNNLEKSCIKSEKSILEIKKLTDDIYKSLNVLSKSSKTSQFNLKEIKEQNDIDFEKFLADIQLTIKMIDAKNEENKDLIPQIKDGIEELALSKTEIVKKIQYQDIIKQKMEHIQKSHNELISELVEFNVPGNENNQINKKLKCFMRIRDISGLQAAQLLMANKEYQSAIEVITNNFIGIGDNIKDATDKCEKAYMFGKVNYTKMFEKIGTYINKANIYIEDYRRQSDLLEQEINAIYIKFNNSEKLINDFKTKVKNLKKTLVLTNEEVSKVALTESELKSATVQFESLINETSMNCKKLETLFETLFSFKKNIEGFVNKTDNILLERIDFSDFKEILKSLQTSGKIISRKLEENDAFTKSMIRKIKNSISKIQYYDYFERIIQEIISELNTVNLKLNNSNNNAISKEENLENLKKYYTMQTEYYVHEKIAKGDSVDIDFNIDENDEVEFF